MDIRIKYCNIVVFLYSGSTGNVLNGVEAKRRTTGVMDIRCPVVTFTGTATSALSDSAKIFLMSGRNWSRPCHPGALFFVIVFAAIALNITDQSVCGGYGFGIFLAAVISTSPSMLIFKSEPGNARSHSCNNPRYRHSGCVG